MKIYWTRTRVLGPNQAKEQWNFFIGKEQLKIFLLESFTTTEWFDYYREA